MAAMRKINDMAWGEKRHVSGAGGLRLRARGHLCSLAQQGGIFASEHLGAKTHCRVDL
jgi:hypothetical protein